VKRKEYSRASGSYPFSLKAATTPSRTRRIMPGREPRNLSPVDHSRIGTTVRSDEQESTSFAGFDDNGKVDEGLGKPDEANAAALVFRQMKGKAWKSSQNPVLVISSTISKDDTAGEEVRQAKLFGEFGRKMQFKTKSFDAIPPQPLLRLDFGNQGSGGGDSTNKLLAAGEKKGVWDYVGTLEGRVKQLSEKVVAMESKEKSQKDKIDRLSEELFSLRSMKSLLNA
jgi:hypothetical protein